MRPIDADVLLDFLDVGHLRPPTEICFSELMMKNIIDIQPTIDAVPIIRCKDCKHWECDDEESYCNELGIFNTDHNSYCSYAKRKDECSQ